MRQVPQYLIIGNGCMASHMCHYFGQMKLPFSQWYRSAYSVAKLDQLLKQVSHVLILIDDSAIEKWAIDSLNKHSHITYIHFSGNLTTKYAYSAHPLCMFVGKEPYSLLEYQNIPFVFDENAPCFSELLPGLNNPSYRIKVADKSYYHAMCVLANNFSVILWEKFFKEMEARFSVSAHDLTPFLEKTFSNIKAYPEIKKTGPLERNDAGTLNSDLDALEEDQFHRIFKSFIDTFARESNHD